ncbi:unnamed protein product [Euphydryas editha]|uniref:Structure-specific endonuclease subunit SLX4 n=1 Tax=Euphydryas editha TaxID=104508 RepID=A0AAU9UFG3_EUPED|nr:unnamed protein product [Euphydryas editha]
MDDSSSEFQAKKKHNTGPKQIQKSKVSKTKKPIKKIKNQKDIRTLIKNKNSELVSYSKAFDQVCKKSGVDVDSEQLQLAIALSKSLQETEIKSDDSSQESKPLSSQEKTKKIRITLQEYGFRVPNTKVSKDSNKRKRIQKQYKLLLVSDEEKKQIISDRYAEVLAKNIHKSPVKNKTTAKDYTDLEVFYKGTNIIYELMKNDDIFYIKDLFEKPSVITFMLRDWANIPGRPASPKREEKNNNFENIQCTQEELDNILSGSVLAAQSIIDNKCTVNNCNIYRNSESMSQAVVIDVENNIELFTNNEVNDASSSKNNLKFDTKLTVTQKVRSVSPDLFDDDASLTSDDINNHVQILQENITQSKNNVTDCMDLTECVSSAPGKDKTLKNELSLKKVNVTNRKSNDVMDITECVPVCFKQYCVDSIDLTQGYVHTKKENNTHNKTENIEIDLTQSKVDLDVPNINTAAIENESLLDDTIINNDYMEIISNKVSFEEILSSQINSKIENDDNTKKEVAKTECLPSSSKQSAIENIDLTLMTYSTIKKSSRYILTENLNTDVAQTNSYVFPLGERSSINTDDSVDNVIIIEDSEIISNPVVKEENSASQKDLKILKAKDFDKNITDENLKPKNIYSFNINLSKENDTNVEMDLTQSSNSDNGSEIDSTKKEDLLYKLSPVINKELSDTPKDSEFVCNESDKSKEQNEVDNFEDNHEFYNYSEHFDNYSYNCNDNDSAKYNSEDNVQNPDFDDISPSYAENPNNNSCIVINDNECNSLKHLDTNNEDKRNVEDAEGIDLTRSSNSSNETVENKDNPKAPDINNLGKINDISIDYDEMFDDVVSVGSKCVSQTSLKSTNNTLNSSKKDEIPNNEKSSPSQTECFEISDKEFNYSMHQSRHNFDIGGVSILDNVSDFEMHSIKEKKQHSRIGLNRSFSDGDIPTTSVNKICTPKAVFNSKKVLSDTSTPVVTKCVIEEVQNTPRNSDYIIKTQNVTPMMDYESMTSPERNRELEKYGLKPFKRKRAIQLLKHLYEQTHPLVESCDAEECSSPSKRQKYNNESQQYISPGKSKRSPRKSPKKSQRSPINSQKSPRKKEPKLAEFDVENTLYVETKHIPDIKEIKCNQEDWVFQKREKAKVHACKVPLHIAFHNYVSCRQRLREAILRYEPINIDVIHKDLVACGYKYNPKDLLRFLDKKCITVKTADNNTRNRK